MSAIAAASRRKYVTLEALMERQIMQMVFENLRVIFLFVFAAVAGPTPAVSKDIDGLSIDIICLVSLEDRSTEFIRSYNGFRLTRDDSQSGDKFIVVRDNYPCFFEIQGGHSGAIGSNSDRSTPPMMLTVDGVEEAHLFSVKNQTAAMRYFMSLCIHTDMGLERPFVPVKLPFSLFEHCSKQVNYLLFVEAAEVTLSVEKLGKNGGSILFISDEIFVNGKRIRLW